MMSLNYTYETKAHVYNFLNDMCKFVSRVWMYFLRVFTLLLFLTSNTQAHPHVFVDGGVDFVMSEDYSLQALKVTWILDVFETLFMLSQAGVKIDERGGLDNKNAQKLINQLAIWFADFDGSAHLYKNDKEILLEKPKDMNVKLVNGRLNIGFIRDLSHPIFMHKQKVGVDFYEASFFYAFSATQQPQIIGAKNICSSQVIPYDPNEETQFLETTLSELGREETPEINNIGALFADRITLKCD